jgi:hypothetical protein
MHNPVISIDGISTGVCSLGACIKISHLLTACGLLLYYNHEHFAELAWS